MSENERVEKDESRVETSAPVEESRVEAAYTAVSDESSGKKGWVKHVVAVLIVVIIFTGVLYVMEKQGRVSTGIFDTVIANQEAKAKVATVNGKSITGADLSTSVNQFSQSATAQGADISTPEAQADIRKQALDVLVNTELLKQEAEKREINITDEDVDTRLEEIKTEIGGEEVLAERMKALSITDEKLHVDIRDELLIKQLLDQIFAESEVVVTDEEISQVYENAGGEGVELPPFEEVKSQISDQLKASKEQEVINAFLEELKGEAEIEIL
ncbi:SurA N-terminal domain-containing protein [Candidatus Nomurabacteria bacterium]|nr:SurA N-terminal domain-containing protein [Candidatus Kaiserbacteria bacterium]MCB9814857.1 SurA N-terminal domain-containing protein [Candidatus Nomurabacteria bacterium]